MDLLNLFSFCIVFMVAGQLLVTLARRFTTAPTLLVPQTSHSAAAAAFSAWTMASTPKTDPVSEVYGLVGEEEIGKLVEGFYRGVEADPVVGPLYLQAVQQRGEKDLSGASTRLREYLVGRFGGPPTYVEKYGHPRLRARHFPFPVDQDGRDRWLRIMEASMAERKFPQAVDESLRHFFTNLSTHMINKE